MNKLIPAILLFSTSGFTFAAESPQEATMEERQWQLREYLVDSGETVSALPGTTVDIKLSEGKLSGSAGCNRYFGSYELEGDQIRFTSQMGSTQMACVPPVAEQEQRYLALLGQTTAWQVDGGQMTLLDAESRAILKYSAAEPTALEGTEWQAAGINNGTGGVASTGSTGLTTATFTDGTVSGSGGCNRFNAAYEIKAEQISIGPAAATRKFCAEPEGLMDQEREFFAALGMARTFAVTPGKLELRDESGSLQVSFRIKTP